MTEGPGPDAAKDKIGAPPDAEGGAAPENGTNAFGDGGAAADIGFGGIRADGGEARCDNPGESPDRCEADSSLLDMVAGALAAPDRQAFLAGLIGALGQSAIAPAGGESGIGVMLRQLGHALAAEFDEEQVFRNIVDALDRKQIRPELLRGSIPVIAALLARIVSRPLLPALSEAMPAEIAALLDSAAQVAREALGKGGARGWRTLPEVATTIARRAAQRALSVAALAEVLPRLWARLAAGPRKAAVPAADPARGRAKGEPRRMILSGPVEIVILER